MTLYTTSSETDSTSWNIDPALTVRPAQMSDLEAAYALFEVQMIEDFGVVGETIDQLRSNWETPNFFLDKSTQVVLAPNGQMIAFVEVWDTHEVPVRPFVWGYVHPEYRRRGIGTALMQWAEQRCHKVAERIPADARIVMHAVAASKQQATNALLQSLNMTHTRNSLSMAIEMQEAPPTPEWPEGIRPSSQAEFNNLKAVYIAQRESFRDHRGFVDEDIDKGFARWEHWVNNDPDYDPSLFILAMKGDEVVGVSLCSAKAWDDPTWGYVNMLGVLRPYRHQGLGKALLLQTFNTFWAKGQPKVALHVDATSITGATRLYERAGMYIKYATHQYEKELRPGRELSNQG